MEKWIYTRKLQQSFSILFGLILSFIFLCLVLWVLYFLFFTIEWRVFLDYEKWWELLISTTLIFFSSIIYIIWFFFWNENREWKLHLQKSQFSQKFSVFSSNHSVGEKFFENPEIQKIFLDFYSRSSYVYDIFLWEKEVILVRNLPWDFLWFSYSPDINYAIKPFIDFYIEQKNIQKFLEEIKVFYK